jgi:predicted RNA binding protein YcfA (HicA-like mRNA interferase family)
MPRESRVPLKVGEMIRLVEADGWLLNRVRGSHRQYVHPTKPGR